MMLDSFYPPNPKSIWKVPVPGYRYLSVAHIFVPFALLKHHIENTVKKLEDDGNFWDYFLPNYTKVIRSIFI